MATMTPQLPTSSSALKHMEKQLLKEGKTEANQVKHSLKDVASTEKAAAKAQKVSPPHRVSLKFFDDFSSVREQGGEAE